MVCAPINNKSEQGHRPNYSHRRENGKVGGNFGRRDDRNGGRGNNRGENSNLPTPEWTSIQLSAFKKDFYKPHETVINRASSEISAYRAEHSITIRGQVPNPIMNFDEVNIPDYVLHEIKKQGFDRPTPIQAQGWPIALSGSNMVGIAKTGSGKTLGKYLFSLFYISERLLSLINHKFTLKFIFFCDL